MELTRRYDAVVLAAGYGARTTALLTPLARHLGDLQVDRTTALRFTEFQPAIFPGVRYMAERQRT